MEFTYTALDERGREVTGALQAESRSAAIARLRSQGMFPMGIEERGAARAAAATAATAAEGTPARSGGLFPRRVSPADLALFTRQLASLFNAGLNMARCLDTLIDHCENATLAEVLRQIRQAVSGGSSLWEAMAEHPRIFSELYISLVQAGEASGQLGKVLERLADQLEQQQERSSRVRSALAYPALLITAGLGAVGFIVLFLVPRFARIFTSLNRPLPTPTRVLIDIQTFLSQNGLWVLIGIVAAVVAVQAWNRTEQGGLVIDRLRMKLPLLGVITHKEAVSRFCRTMATLVEGGVPILSAFDVAERAVGNRVLRAAIVQVRAAVREGESVAEPLRRSGVFPGLVTNMIAVGEETGNLQEMLNRVSDAYDAEVANRLRQLVSMVEPAVILLMGGIIGTIVISMLIPVLEISTGIGG